jgi:hypothetical protein
MAGDLGFGLVHRGVDPRPDSRPEGAASKTARGRARRERDDEVPNTDAKVALAAVMLLAAVETVPGDWKSDIARAAIGRAAQAGIEHAFKDAVTDAAFDAAMSAVATNAGNVGVPNPSEVVVPSTTTEPPVVGSTAAAAVDAAMTAADVASAVDTVQDVADAARTIRKVNDVRKAITRIHR